MNYCLGFILNRDLSRVLLVKKNRGPKQLVGKLNGIGGKLENKETAVMALRRECREETGLEIDDWSYFCTIDYLDDQISCFYSITEQIFDYKQLEDEIIGIYNLEYIEGKMDLFYKNYDYVPQLDWLLPMILNHQDGSDPTILFKVELL